VRAPNPTDRATLEFARLLGTKVISVKRSLIVTSLIRPFVECRSSNDGLKRDYED
jgi:hypothetical protein